MEPEILVLLLLALAMSFPLAVLLGGGVGRGAGKTLSCWGNVFSISGGIIACVGVPLLWHQTNDLFKKRAADQEETRQGQRALAITPLVQDATRPFHDMALFLGRLRPDLPESEWKTAFNAYSMVHKATPEEVDSLLFVANSDTTRNIASSLLGLRLPRNLDSRSDWVQLLSGSVKEEAEFLKNAPALGKAAMTMDDRYRTMKAIIPRGDEGERGR